MDCLHCQKSFEPKQKFCCSLCRASYFQKNKSGSPKKTKSKAELQKMIDAVPPRREIPMPVPLSVYPRVPYQPDPRYNYEKGFDDLDAAIEL